MILFVELLSQYMQQPEQKKKQISKQQRSRKKNYISEQIILQPSTNKQKGRKQTQQSSAFGKQNTNPSLNHTCNKISINANIPQKVLHYQSIQQTITNKCKPTKKNKDFVNNEKQNRTRARAT